MCSVWSRSVSRSSERAQTATSRPLRPGRRYVLVRRHVHGHLALRAPVRPVPAVALDALARVPAHDHGARCELVPVRAVPTRERLTVLAELVEYPRSR
jgi:hypothetical protein